MIEAMEQRRSIRAYEDRPVSRELLEEILRAGTLAPSSKNRQPWRFVVVTGQAKAEMLAVMKAGLEREKTAPLLPDSRQHLAGAERTREIMEQAPAVIFVLNPLGLDLYAPLTPEERIFELCNIQSAGAALENMTLAAAELGLGSLWICDVFFAYQELTEWLNAKGGLLAALAVGYAAENPPPRPRKSVETVTEWRT